jgi:hypothetical protein
VEFRHVGPRGSGIEVSEEWVALVAGMACVGAEVEVTHGRMPASGVRFSGRRGSTVGFVRLAVVIWRQQANIRGRAFLCEKDINILQQF